MFGFIKNILRKSESAPVSRPAPARPRMPMRPAVPTVTGPTLAHVRKTLAQPQSQTGGAGVKVPLQPILSSLPLELQPRVLTPDVGGMQVSIPLEKVLAQLSRGCVKISFGELRQAAPEVFSPEADRDRVLVSVPLAEILPQLSPALIQRRRAQKHVEVPAEISGPFECTGQAVEPAEENVEPEPAPVAAPVLRQAIPAQAPAAPPAAISMRQAPAANPPAAIPMRQAPAANPPAAIPMQQVSRANPPAAIPMSQVAHAAPPAPIAMPQPNSPVSGPLPGRKSLTSAPTPPPPAATPPVAPVLPPPRPVLDPNASNGNRGNGKSGAEPLVLGLTSLADTWPEAVRKEIVGLSLADAKVALPYEEIEQALKQGKIVFTWKSIRSWIRPAPLPAVSAHDNTVLELPLSVVAPVFIERQRQNSKPHQKVDIDEDIPNLFFGFPQPEGAPTGANAKPGDSNFYVWDDSSDSVKVHESETKRGPSPGTRFVAKYATPNEVVSRAAAMEGVAGSLIALPDGLMVASQLPSDVNGDTLAAFLPQIFGKVSQCTRELRMGELNNLNFTVGNVPWKIFRVNSIFFAAFGRAGEPLPTMQLAGLAAELDHKPK